MKKVLIIAYYFPPANFVGAERTNYWANNLHNYNLYPVVVTKNWSENQTLVLESKGTNELKIDKHDQFEVHRLPSRSNLRSKISISIIRKILSFLKLIQINVLPQTTNLKQFETYCDKLITEQNIDFVIVSGRPFEFFYVGYKLKRKHPNIKWIPDYRDEWNSHSNFADSGFIWNMIHKLEAKNEIKWTNNADLFTTVSEEWKSSIGNFIRKPGLTVMNGYDENTIHQTDNYSKSPNSLTITYAGTIYHLQPIEPILTVLNRLAEDGLNINVNFIGIETIPSQVERVSNLLGEKIQYSIKKRLTNQELNSELENTDLFILTAFDKVKGWYPVKLFDYYKRNRKILLYPSDKDVMEDFIKATNSGFSSNNEEATYNYIKELYQKAVDPSNNSGNDFNLGAFYSRGHQTKILASYLNSME